MRVALELTHRFKISRRSRKSSSAAIRDEEEDWAPHWTLRKGVRDWSDED